MSWMSFQMQQQLNAQKLTRDSKKNNAEVMKGDQRLKPSQASFKNDRAADSGVFESEVTDSVADSGGSWGSATPDSGVVESEPVAYHGDADGAEEAHHGDADGAEEAYEEAAEY